MASSVEINASVLSYSQQSSSDAVVYYDLTVTHVPLARRWQVQRRYREFEALHAHLRSFFCDFPPLPPKSLWRRSDAVFLRDRREKLDEFLRSVTSRAVFTRCAAVREFLEVGTFAPEAVLATWQLRSLSHTDMALLRASVAPQCIAGLARNTSAQPICSFLARETPDTPFTLLWTQILPLPPTAVTWSGELTMLAIGFENGVVDVYRIYTELECRKYELFARLPAHSDAVKALAMNCLNSHLYSVAKDCVFLVTDINSQAKVMEIALKATPRTVTFISDFSRVYIATKRNVVFFNTETLKSTMEIRPSASISLTAITVLPAVSRIFCGTTTGKICLFRLGMLDCEETTCEEPAWLWRGKITALVGARDRTEVVAGNSEGLVTVWDAWKGEMQTVVRADAGKIVEIGYGESGIVVVGRGNQDIKDYQLPGNWTTYISHTDVAPCSIPSAWKATEDDLSGWDQ